MKKLFVLAFLVILLLGISACREKTTSTTTETGEETSETTEEGTTAETATTETEEDVDANEDIFVQTGEAEEDATLTLTGAEPSTIVVDLGDLVTLKVTSERLKAVEFYNADLHVNQTIARGETATITIEANEEGIFYLKDNTMNEDLIRFMVAGTDFG